MIQQSLIQQEAKLIYGTFVLAFFPLGIHEQGSDGVYCILDEKPTDQPMGQERFQRGVHSMSQVFHQLMNNLIMFLFFSLFPIGFLTSFAVSIMNKRAAHTFRKVSL